MSYIVENSMDNKQNNYKRWVDLCSLFYASTEKYIEVSPKGFCTKFVRIKENLD